LNYKINAVKRLPGNGEQTTSRKRGKKGCEKEKGGVDSLLQTALHKNSYDSRQTET
jgi:hypothetical protein